MVFTWGFEAASVVGAVDYAYCGVAKFDQTLTRGGVSSTDGVRSTFLGTKGLAFVTQRSMEALRSFDQFKEPNDIAALIKAPQEIDMALSSFYKRYSVKKGKSCIATEYKEKTPLFTPTSVSFLVNQFGSILNEQELVSKSSRGLDQIHKKYKDLTMNGNREISLAQEDADSLVSGASIIEQFNGDYLKNPLFKKYNPLPRKQMYFLGVTVFTGSLLFMFGALTAYLLRLILNLRSTIQF